jgi:hypothetical protein
VRALRLLLWPAGAAIGIGAEWVSFGWSEPGDWLPDLVVGWTLIACGLVGWSRRPESRSGALMAATGFAWFAANFASEQALYLHRGPLIHLVVSYPYGRLGGRVDRSVVAIAYVAALIPAVWRSEAATFMLAGLVVTAAGHGYARAVGREQRTRLAALQATASSPLSLRAPRPFGLPLPLRRSPTQRCSPTRPDFARLRSPCSQGSSESRGSAPGSRTWSSTWARAGLERCVTPSLARSAIPASRSATGWAAATSTRMDVRSCCRHPVRIVG